MDIEKDSQLYHGIEFELNPFQTIVNEAMGVNDTENLTPSEREEKLKEIFLEFNPSVVVEFIN